MPAHITVLYPFKPPSEIDNVVHERLRRLFARIPSFNFSLAEMRRFPEVLYLAPTPDAPFKELIRAVASEFPETPPYGGAFAEAIPHLTVAQLADAVKLEHIAAEFQRAAGNQLPIRAAVSEVALMDNESGPWRVRTEFAFGKDKL
jgi:2'-5' RNA ligase